MLYILCQVEVPKEEPPASTQKRLGIIPHRPQADPPPELVVLPESATLQDFKEAAASAFRDIYYAFRNFEVGRGCTFQSFD